MADLSRHFEKAEKALQKGKIDAALDAYEDALEEDPTDERARESAADLCLNLNQNARAGELLGSLFRDHVRTANAPKAVATYRKLVRINMTVSDLLMEYGRMLENAGNKKAEAVEAYEAALRHFHSTSEMELAMAAINHIVAIDPKPDNYRRQAEFASEVGNHDAAAKAYLELAQALEKANFDASEAYEKAHAENPKEIAACLGLCRALVAKGRTDEALKLLEPLATAPNAPFEVREPYVMALHAAGRTLDIEPFIWDLFDRNPQEYGPILGEIITSLASSGRTDRAITLARRLEEYQRRAGRRREFLQQMKEISDRRAGDTEFLEYMAELYDGSNREADYCETLATLFDLYYASGNYLKACDSLERAVEVDSYESGHQDRLERLRGRIDANRLSMTAARLGIANAPEESKVTSRILPVEEELCTTSSTTSGSEPTVLEDLVLQAEIFLQYGMRNKAIEKIERIHKVFPREEQNNQRVQDLYNNSGFIPSYSGPAQALPAPAPARTVNSQGGEAPDTIAAEDLGRAAEVNRNIGRQANVKSVLFAAVNDVGRNWNASRCMAGLCRPGKPPSAVVEFCAPSVKQCDVPSIVKLIMGLQPICADRGGSVAYNDASASDDLKALAPIIAAHSIGALLAVPMQDGDQQVGLLLLIQSGTPRNWRQSETAVLQTIADQMVLAINNARLRSLDKTLAVTDEKSGLLKRSSYLDVVLSEVRRAMQQHSPLSLILMQVGKPSLVRELGEVGVENMMQQVGQIIATHIRQNDVAVRYADNQVALLLSDTDEKNSVLAVEKLRRVLSAIRVPDHEKAPTVTAGIAEMVPMPDYEPVDVVTDVINRVEQALSLARTASKTGVFALPRLPVTIGT